MNNDMDVIIEKIQKLLRLAESQNEYESQSAIAKARKLMTKHKLSMEDVKEKEEKVIEDSTEAMRSPWKRALATMIAKHFRCKTFIRSRGNTYRVVFLGLEDDVIITSMIYRQVVNIINSISRRKKIDKKSYSIGFIQGLHEKLEAQNNMMNDEEYAIIAITPVPVVNRYNELEKSFCGDFKGKRLGDEDINYQDYEKGKEDGLNYCKDEEIEEAMQSEY